MTDFVAGFIAGCLVAATIAVYLLARQELTHWSRMGHWFEREFERAIEEGTFGE